MDLESVCKNIYYAGYVAAARAEAPVAYIRAKIAGDFPFTKEELVATFNKLKWNTNLSTADLALEEDSSLPSRQLEIVSVEEFMDDEGNAEVHQIHDEDKIIKA